MNNDFLLLLQKFNLLNYFISSFLIFIIGICFVYIVGRMFEIINSNRGRNFVALITIGCATYLRIYINFKTYNISFLYNYLIIFSGAIVLYVLIGFTLFDRVDKFLDKKFAPDKKLIKRRKKNGTK